MSAIYTVEIDCPRYTRERLIVHDTVERLVVRDTLERLVVHDTIERLVVCDTVERLIAHDVPWIDWLFAIQWRYSLSTVQ